MPPVVVEKPFTDTSDVADKLIALAKTKGKLLSVFQSMLYPDTSDLNPRGR
jgi:predicted dehydrogenase